MVLRTASQKGGFSPFCNGLNLHKCPVTSLLLTYLQDRNKCVALDHPTRPWTVTRCCRGIYFTQFQSSLAPTSRQSDTLENIGRFRQYPHVQQWANFVCCRRVVSWEWVQQTTCGRVTIMSVSAVRKLSGHELQLKYCWLSFMSSFALPSGGASSRDTCSSPSNDMLPSSSTNICSSS